MKINPIRANFEITNKCNLRCKHCYFFKQLKQKPPLNYLQVEKIIKKLIKFGIFELSIGGGEPFMFKDLERILLLSTKRMYVVVSTNGLLLDDKKINFLSKLKNFSLQISLDGNEKNHKKIRAITSNDFKKIDIIIKKCSSKINTQIGFMLCHLNINDIDFITKYCLMHNIKRLAILPYIGTQKEFKLSLKDKKRALNILTKYRKKINIYIRDPEMNYAFNKEECFCEAGNTTFNIDCYGNVSPCSYINYNIGNILELKKIEIKKKCLNKFKNFCRKKCITNQIINKT